MGIEYGSLVTFRPWCRADNSRGKARSLVLRAPRTSGSQCLLCTLFWRSNEHYHNTTQRLLCHHFQVTHLAGLTSRGPCLWACQQGPRVRRFPQDLHTNAQEKKTTHNNALLPLRLVTALLLVLCTPCSSSSEGHRCLQFTLMARSVKHNQAQQRTTAHNNASNSTPSNALQRTTTHYYHSAW